MPDRYAAAVRSRRAELRADRARLAGYRAEIRTSLAMSRLALATDLDGWVTELERETRAHVERGDRVTRRQLPARVAVAVGRAQAELPGRWADVTLPPLRRVAAQRSGPGAPLLAVPTTASGAPIALPAPEPPSGALRALLVPTACGSAWRPAVLRGLGVPVLGLPVLGLPVWLPAPVGPALWPLGGGIGLAALAGAAWLRLAAADRARLRRWSAEALVAVRRGVHTELGRWLLDTERRTVGVLDATVTRRRAEIDVELAALAAESAEVPGAQG